MLPPETQKILQKLYDERTTDPALFYAYVANLHNGGWSFDDISRPLGVSRSIVGQWKRRALTATPPQPTADLLPVPQKPKPLKGTIKKIKPDIPPAEREHILTLAQTARNRTRWSRKDSPEVAAAMELTSLIQKHLDRGVSITRIAEIAQVNRRAIMQRIEK